MTTKTKNKIALKFFAQQRALEAGKAGYERANVLLEEIVGLVKPGETITLPDGSTGQLVDKFEKKNRIGTGMGVNRYEIEVSRAKDISDRL